MAFPEAVPLGIDVEMVNFGKTHVLAAQATDQEKALVGDLPFPYPDMLTLLWTAKEALAKALKIGLTASYHIFEIGQIEVGPSSIVCRFKHLRQYKTTSFNLSNYICSIAYPARTDIVFEAPQKIMPDYQDMAKTTWRHQYP